jgi:hypothetical protein
MWERVLHYGWFAEVYHWTPDQVERLPHWYAERIQAFHAMVEDVRQEEAEAAQKAR